MMTMIMMITMTNDNDSDDERAIQFLSLVGVFGLRLTHGHMDIKTTNTEMERN